MRVDERERELAKIILFSNLIEISSDMPTLSAFFFFYNLKSLLVLSLTLHNREKLKVSSIAQQNKYY